MGCPKHQLLGPDGQTLLAYQCRRFVDHFARVFLLAGGFPIEPGIPGTPLSDPDGFCGEGPLAGLLAAMQAADTPWVALLAVDQPAVQPDHHRYALQLAGPADQAVVFRDSDGRIQWLCGLYRTSLKSELESEMRRGVRAVKKFGSGLRLRTVEAEDQNVFLNLNTPEEARSHGWELPSSR